MKVIDFKNASCKHCYKCVRSCSVKAIKVKDINQAGRIQQEFLNKMPMNTQSQSGSFDFGEWSIFWSYHDQSLEYYVGRYGVFYAHVDRDGVEHKAEFKDRY